MTRHTTISSLSIAAIALLAAAVPSFAQAQLDQSSRDSVDTPAIEQTIASNTELVAAAKLRVTTPAASEVDGSPVKNVTRTAGPTLPASAFKLHNNSTSGLSSQFVNPKPTFNYASPSDSSARKQFRSDDYDSSSTGRKLTFVPSRGQKLPDQQSW